MSIVTGVPSQDAQPHTSTALRPDQARCYYCGAIYSRGDPEGDTLIRYPQAEYRYWGHCLTNQHQIVMEHLDRQMAQLLRQAPTALAEGKKMQKMLNNPVFKAIKQVMG